MKLRKQEAAARAAEREDFETQAAVKPAVRPPLQTTINPAALDVKVRVARKPSVQKPRPSIPDEDTNNQRDAVPVDKEVLRRATWKVSPMLLPRSHFD